jgi:hypothetical protein
MAGKVVNSNFVLLSKFSASRKESVLKTATSHIRKPLVAILPQKTKNEQLNIEIKCLT